MSVNRLWPGWVGGQGQQTSDSSASMLMRRDGARRCCFLARLTWPLCVECVGAGITRVRATQGGGRASADRKSIAARRYTSGTTNHIPAWSASDHNTLGRETCNMAEPIQQAVKNQKANSAARKKKLFASTLRQSWIDSVQICCHRKFRVMLIIPASIDNALSSSGYQPFSITGSR